MRRGNYGADLGETGRGIFFAMRLDRWNRIDLAREIRVLAQGHEPNDMGHEDDADRLRARAAAFHDRKISPYVVVQSKEGEIPWN
jgi:hypothetical protein